MDPNETLCVILWNLVHLGDGGLDDEDYRKCAIQSLRDLADWLERDGFPPRVDRYVGDVTSYVVEETD